jgi:hypothetical protein
MSQHNTQPSNSPLRLDLGDGQYIDMDRPAAHILEAVQRMDAAIKRGDNPKPEDAVLVWNWNEEQSAKHGDVQGKRK